jgi:DNA-binding transcriptional MerR regulator
MGDDMDEPADTTTGHLTVAQVAALAGITVRTLHHYDRIGLLVPSQRSEAEYRLYAPADVARLREILTWRRLDVPLAEVARLLDDPTVDRIEVLRRQRTLVAARIDELRQLATALDHALETTDDEGTTTMGTDQEIIDALDGFDPADYETEVRERWGGEDAYVESARRTKAYTPDDWRRIKAEGDDINRRLAEQWEAGAPADGEQAVALAEAWRAHISRWFYECPPEMLRGLGEMYVADPRFTVAYDGADGERAGFAAWVRDAWVARADAG